LPLASHNLGIFWNAEFQTNSVLRQFHFQLKFLPTLLQREGMPLPTTFTLFGLVPMISSQESTRKIRLPILSTGSIYLGKRAHGLSSWLAAGFIFISVVSSRGSPGSTLPLARLGVSASMER
jgi:hypothetical protein